MRYNLSKQEQENWCVPACLQAVLRRYDIHEEQKDIANALGTNKNGTRVEKIKGFLWTRGFNFEDYNYNQVPFKEPGLLLEDAYMRGQDMVVDVELQNKLKHFLLVEALTRDNIAMLDPNNVSRVVRNLDKLYGKMFQRKMGGFGIIKKLD